MMTGSTALDVLVYLLMVAGGLAALFGEASVGGWLDRRAEVRAARNKAEVG